MVKTTQEMYAIISYAIDSYSRNVSNLDDVIQERHFGFEVLKIRDYFKVEWSIVEEFEEITNRNSNDISPNFKEPKFYNDYFKVLETDNFRKLESYIEDMCTIIETFRNK